MPDAPFHQRCPQANGRWSWDGEVWQLQPEAPAGTSGNGWYALCVGLNASSESIPVHIQWLALVDQAGGDYASNQSFATVLDRVCCIDEGDGRWRLLSAVRLVDDGALLSLPPGGPNRRFAVGMPADASDLHALLTAAQASPHAALRCLGHATRGSPVWGVTISEGHAAQGTIVVQSLQHAQEWAGLRAHRHLVEFLLSPAAAALRQRWRWLCYPATNADGLYLGWRGDPMVVDDYNPNRDWGVFRLPEVRAVADDLLAQLAQGPALAHAVDLHMGWNWRSDPGSAVGVAAGDGDLDNWAAWHHAFADALIAGAQHTQHHWAVHRRGRPTFPGWLHAESGVHGQTIEISRHQWPDGHGGWELPSQQREERFGSDLARVLDAFLTQHPAPVD